MAKTQLYAPLSLLASLVAVPAVRTVKPQLEERRHKAMRRYRDYHAHTPPLATNWSEKKRSLIPRVIPQVTKNPKIEYTYRWKK